ncbi:MAG: FecR domain-containing protein [Rudaea sp.]
MSNSKKIERTAAIWVARRDSEAWSQGDQADLDAWLEQAVAHKVAFLRLAAAWRHSDRLKALGAGLAIGSMPARGDWTLSPFIDRRGADATPSAQTPAINPIDRGRDSARTKTGDSDNVARAPIRSRSKRLAMLGAAGLILCCGLAVVLMWQYGAAVQQAAYRTPLGALRSVGLADGSEATLNSDSAIGVDLTRLERNIDLRRGEVFFKVAKDPQRPFVVSVGNHRVIAVGTRFSVWRDGKRLRVVVTEGVVRLESNNAPGLESRPTTLLPAGSVAEVDDANLRIRQVALEQATQMLSWRNGYLAFDDTPLSVAAAEFNRYNRQQIVVIDPAVGNLRVGGNFRWSNTNGFVRLLEQGFPVRAKHSEDHIMLTHR